MPAVVGHCPRDRVPDSTDVPPSGELRVCHYQMGKIVTLKGPLRATVSRDGVTLANGKAVLAGTGPCAAPLPSTVQGGIVTRGVSDDPVRNGRTVDSDLAWSPVSHYQDALTQALQPQARPPKRGVPNRWCCSCRFTRLLAERLCRGAHLSVPRDRCAA